ncbi:hypothetical protein GAO09_07765 [Rhizobiales bacterium RZME27]|uniref:RiboL-PSP-HEPN domain-containing protein n=1 Tax=Endobacterium cereale TaxID=2663029 RepID=A0A6A8A5N3_9HYPH|nr:MAE_28990/MAE_18760 family HEPN-like nuclease [Endobacterium cereale]MQY45954.1 hypothetical protein [Endobacterium cereale]
MYNAYLSRTHEAIGALAKHIRTSDNLRTLVLDETPKKPNGASIQVIAPADAPSSVEWRIIDHCAAVTRIYAIYEQFAHEMIREHLSLLQGRMPFMDLPDAIKSSYRQGLAKILDKKDRARFADIDLSQLIGTYNSALGGLEYSLEPKAMLMQEQNLRLPELNRFMNACGIEGVQSWIENHRRVKEFFAAGDRLTGTAESQMAELIKFRNDAAHGTIDISDLLHLNVHLEFCDFISAVCEALAERVQLAGLFTLKPYKHATERGKVSESMKNGSVAIGLMLGRFAVGDTIYLCGDNYCLERRVSSLQLDSVPQESVDFTTATELGMLLDAPGKKNAIIYALEAATATVSSDPPLPDTHEEAVSASKPTIARSQRRYLRWQTNYR